MDGFYFYLFFYLDFSGPEVYIYKKNQAKTISPSGRHPFISLLPDNRKWLLILKYDFYHLKTFHAKVLISLRGLKKNTFQKEIYLFFSICIECTVI